MKIIHSYNKLKESRRKCVLCGRSPYSDSITLYRFPKPGPRNTMRCEMWAKFVYPGREFSSAEFQSKLYKEHRMVCEKHFKLSSFIDYSMKKLHRHAHPEMLHAQEHDPLELTITDLGRYESTKTYDGVDTRMVAPSNDAITDLQRAESSSNEKHFVTGHKSEKESDIECVSHEKPERISTYKESPHESIVPAAKIYSWQKRSEVVADQLDDEVDNISMYCEDEDSASLPDDTSDNEDEMTHEGFRCNVCDKTIHGFRYTCVQCHDFDLCGACESNREHQQHYILRVPTPRPAAEVQFVLATVRRHLMKRIDTTEGDQDLDDAVSIKSEVKSEIEDDDYNVRKRTPGPESDSSDTMTLEQPCEEEVECSMMASVMESPAVGCVVGTDQDEIPTDADTIHTIVTTECGDVAIQEQPRTRQDSACLSLTTTTPKRIFINKIQDLTILKDCMSAKKITIPPIPYTPFNKHIPRILLKNKNLIKPHIKLKITKLPPGAIVKCVPRGPLEPPRGNTTDHNVDNR